ncbi:cytochrome p450 family protein [Naegleria gruberi]|uniref:Cytochrome p450 family protein n=1 Tax=Naegleria gruberi TaxID=5762 RepID=D2W086_NAEGR|nr:cytochrome p450 family protein [Naegleria gruberi]EFC37529.1 cytochrome p450 family protein [Naegleria gruberi]|eukprot:XP_002670273.1 cytochrome p450 family protein [Naegleria gruberi strain NEG-M]
MTEEIGLIGSFNQLFTLSFFNVFLLIVCLVSYLLIRYTITFFTIYFKFKHLPGYVSFFPPLIDSMIHRKIYVHHLYDCALNSFKNNPSAKVVKIQLGTFSQIHISNDENLIREILVKKYKTVSKGNLFEPVGIFGPNIFSADSNDPIWRKHRTLANPIFSSSSHLKNVFRVTLEECKKMIKFWKSIYGSESDGTIRKVNISNELKSITLDVINRVAFDYDVGIFDKDAAHRDGIHDWINNLLNGLIYNFVLPKYLLSKSELLSAIFIVLFAGFETSSTSLTFMLRMLAKDQKLQEEILKEINQEIDNIDDITFEIITNKLPLLTSFIKEVLRTKTPIGTGGRIVLKKNGEVIGGVHYPKDTHIGVSYYSQHYFAKNGLDEFNPYRFLTTKSDSSSNELEKSDNNEFENDGKGPMGELSINLATDKLLPFSIGPRDCIGKRMALLEMKLILVFLLKNYKLKVPKGLETQQDSIKETYVVTRTIFEPYLVDFETRL